MDSPIPVIPLTYANAPANGVQVRPILPTVSVAVCLVAVVLIVVMAVESVLWTGPVLFIFGGVMLGQGLKRHDKLRAILGGAHCAVCALFVVLVNLWRWSPGEASTPFLVMGVTYTLLASGITVQMWLRYTRTL